jgi:hypothetical protein
MIFLSAKQETFFQFFEINGYQMFLKLMGRGKGGGKSETDEFHLFKICSAKNNFLPRYLNWRPFTQFDHIA